MKHTPGPWKIANHGNGKQQLPIYGNNKTEIAVLTNGGLKDAKLISAAPDLLEACQFANDWLRTHTKAMDRPAALDKILWEAIQKAQG